MWGLQSLYCVKSFEQFIRVWEAVVHVNWVTISFDFSLSSVVRKISVDSPEIINLINDAGVVYCFSTFGIGNVGRVTKICSRNRERGCWKGWQSMIIIVFVLSVHKSSSCNRNLVSNQSYTKHVVFEISKKFWWRGDVSAFCWRNKSTLYKLFIFPVLVVFCIYALKIHHFTSFFYYDKIN